MSIKVIDLRIGHDSWAKVYLEPDCRWSQGGGRITVNIDDDHVGSHFFSHVASETLEDFISSCGEDYLVHKLFQTKQWVSVADSDELLECIAREHLDRVKQARYSGLSKSKLRDLYEDLQGRGFHNLSELFHQLDSDSCDTMAAIFGDDWWYETLLTKTNHVYAWHLECIQAIQNHLKLKVAA